MRVDVGPWLALIVAAAILAPVVWYVATLQGRRARAYAAFAAASGYQYVFNRPGEQEKYEAMLPLFNQGYSRHWRHEISGTFNGMAFTAFEYVYTISAGRSTSTISQSLIKWESATAMLPQFTLGPESFFSRIGQALGSPDIDFPEDEAFSRSYVLKGGDESAVRTLFTQALRAELAGRPGQHAAGAGRILFWWQNGSLATPAWFGDFLSSGDRIRQDFFAG
jgi:hypothetical protein